MSGLLGGGTTTYGERVGSFVVQSSSQGVGITLAWGRCRIAPNLLWMGDFKAIENKQKQGGKGGGSSTVSYTYEASVLLGLCAGQIGGVRRIWVDKDLHESGQRNLPGQQRTFRRTVPADGVLNVDDADWASTVYVINLSFDSEIVTDYTVAAGVYSFPNHVGAELLIVYTTRDQVENYGALQSAGFSVFAGGAVGQAPWGYLQTAYPDQAIGYSAVAYVAATGLPLATSGGLRQYSFEIDARRQVGGGNADANPADVCTDLLLDPIYGAAAGATWVDSLSQYRAWCAARGLFLSPAYSERKGVFEHIDRLADMTFAVPLWRVDRFTIVPLATESVGGFVPLSEHSVPVYRITDDDLQEPIEETRSAPTDRYNRVSVQYSNRDQNYATAVEMAEDKASIDAYGLIAEPEVFKAEEAATPAVAAMIAELRLRKRLSTVAAYRFTLPVSFDLLDPLDIITIEDERIDLPPTAVRITQIEEGDDGSLSIEAEDVAITGDVTQASQPSTGFGYVPTPPDSTHLQVVILPTAATGDVQRAQIGGTAGENWSGASIWVSDTGTDYRQIGEIKTRARMGALSTGLPSSFNELDTSNSLIVNVQGAAGPLVTAQQTDVDALRTLMWVDGELVAYRDAELMASRRFSLTYLRRALYGTEAASHASGSAWMRLDETVITMDVPVEMLGKQVFFKATSRNLLGTYEQGLEEVAALVVNVVAVESLPGAPKNLALTGPFVGASFEVNWGGAARADLYDVEILHAGVVLRALQTSAQAFRYMYADAIDDGGAERTYTVRVRGRNAAGAGTLIQLSVSNPAPAAVIGLAAAGSGATRTVSWTESDAADLAGYRAWYSTTDGFDPKAEEGVQFYDGPAATAELPGLLPSTTYYVRAAAYDVWSSNVVDLNLSTQYSFVTEAEPEE